jgi:hypothetical protein
MLLMMMIKRNLQNFKHRTPRMFRERQVGCDGSPWWFCGRFRGQTHTSLFQYTDDAVSVFEEAIEVPASYRSLTIFCPMPLARAPYSVSSFSCS